MSWAIFKTDPRKTIQVGSFRVDPQGNQNRREVPYARSETHLMELAETICSKTSDYGKSTDEGTQRGHFVRTNSREPGKHLLVNNIQIGGDISAKLKFACESLMEDHEEDIVNTFKSAAPDPDRSICMDTLGLCDEVDLLLPMGGPVGNPRGASELEVEDGAGVTKQTYETILGQDVPEGAGVPNGKIEL